MSVIEGMGEGSNMEKIKKPLRMNYPIVRLYKSDLDKIFNLFKDNYPKIEIVADGFKLDDISELSKIKKQEIVDFEISAYNPRLSVDFSGNSASIYLSDEDDIKLRGLAAQIGDILSKRKSPLRFLASFWLEIPIGMIALLIYFNALSLIKDTKFQVMALLGFVLFMILFGILGHRIEEKKHCLIYLYDRSSAPGFFKRNKDNILIIVISALIGSFLTLVSAWLLKKI
jgi:hypothetical protein